MNPRTLTPIAGVGFVISLVSAILSFTTTLGWPVLLLSAVSIAIAGPVLVISIIQLRKAKTHVYR